MLPVSLGKTIRNIQFNTLNSVTVPAAEVCVHDADVKWEPGLKEEMEVYGLDSQIITVLGKEGYIQKRMLTKCKEDLLTIELRMLNIPSAQIVLIVSLIQDIKGEKPVKVKKTKDIMMTEKHQAILQKCKPFLPANMEPEMVMEILHSKMLLTKYDRDVCKAEKVSYDKVVKLLDLLSQQTEGAFWGLIRALQLTNQKHLANMIEECVSKEGRLFIYTLYHIYIVFTTCIYVHT